MKEKLLELVSTCKTKKYSQQIKKDKQLYDWLITATKHIPKNSSILERVYCVLHDATPFCERGNMKKFTQNLTKGYMFCGIPSKCLCARENHSQKIAKAKSLMTPIQIDDANRKRKSTVLKKYGVEFNSQNQEIKEKKKKTNLIKYGVSTNLLSAGNIEKSRNTMLQKYGVNSPLQSELILQKVQATNLQKYGNICSAQSLAIREQIYENHMKTYNVKLFPKKKYNNEQIALLTSADLLQQELTNFGGVNALAVAYNLHVDRIKFRLDTWGIEYDRNLTVIEEFVKRILDEHQVEYTYRDRKLIAPYELDFVCNERKIAIEVNGLYWHCEKFVDDNYHLMKLDQVNKLGYRLITIFSDEIDQNPSIVRNRLAHFFNKSMKLPGARKCTIAEISSSRAKEFLDNNHIQGNGLASIKLGAFAEDRLMAVMTFGKNRIFMKSTEPHFELIRFASLGNSPGIASKMFSYFCKKYNPTKIISYADRRWGNGDVYKTLGFKLERISDPNYWYTRDCLSREHRYNYTKYSLIKKGHDATLTEKEIMKNLGYLRIYDCGTLKFVWDK